MDIFPSVIPFRHSAQIFEIAVLYTFSGIINMLVKVPAGYLADRYGRKILVVISGFVLSLSAFIFAMSTDVIAAGGAYLLFTAGSSALSPALMAMLTESVRREQRGTAIGVFYSSAPSLASIGPTVGGVLSERYGFKMLFWMGFILLLAVAGIRAKFLKETLQPTFSDAEKKLCHSCPAFALSQRVKS